MTCILNWMAYGFMVGCSGDHDLMVPHLGTQAWVRSLNFPIVDEWRAWHLGGQAAGWVFNLPPALFSLLDSYIWLLPNLLFFSLFVADDSLFMHLCSYFVQVHDKLLQQHDVRDNQSTFSSIHIWSVDVIFMLIRYLVTNWNGFALELQGAGHTAPEYEPERCFAMFSRWILNHPL